MTGRIVARGLGRRFTIHTGGRRSLKETLLRGAGSETHDFWALRDIDLEIEPGETVGLVGRNGSGKSTILSLIAGIFRPSEGTLEVGGEVGSLLELGAGFHPELSGIENVYLNAAIHGLDRRYVNEHLDEIVCFAELEEFAHMPVKTYSSGMFLRLGFSVAIHISPDVLLVDEVLAVGDKVFQRRCFEKIVEFKKRGGTLVLVSHDPLVIETLCDRAVLLSHGRLVAEDRTDVVLRTYQERFVAGDVPG